MVDTHLINMFLIGFGIAAGAAVLIAISFVAAAPALRNRIRNGDLFAGTSVTEPRSDVRTVAPGRRAVPASPQRTLREPAPREHAMR